MGPERMTPCPDCALQDIALVESCPATFQSPYKRHELPGSPKDPQQCVLLRAGGHLSVLDMDQGVLRAPQIRKTSSLKAPDESEFA